MAEAFDLIVIGSGPGGYVAAIRAAQLGMRVACVEKDPSLGGTCLNVGCIPSKALLESSERFWEARHGLSAHGIRIEGASLDLPAMFERKDKMVKQLTSGIQMLFRKHKIVRMQGFGRLAGENKVEVVSESSATSLTSRHILLATGSVPAALAGVEPDGDRIGTSTDALAYPEVPAHLIVIGAGIIGLELGSVWARLGSRVSVLEAMPGLLPMLDEDVSKLALKLFRAQGLELSFGVKVTGAEKVGQGVRVAFEDAGGQAQSLDGERVLVAIGRKPAAEGLRAEKVGIQVDARGFVVVDERCHTGVGSIWAIGDLVRGPMLAHKASEEGIAVVERIAGLSGHVGYDAIPSIIYTQPEVAWLGKSARELEAAKVPIRSGSFPFLANGRAKALAQTDGLVKIHAHRDTDRILGAQIIGARAGDMIAELALAVEFSASAEDIARSVHAHPTLAEIVKEAALAVGGRVLHL